MSQLHELTAREQAVAVCMREISSRELTEYHLDRIDKINPTVGAFTTVAAEYALAEAEVADRAVLAGDGLSPLHGVPTAVKDLNLVAGMRTTFGSAAFSSFIPDLDDNVTALLRGAGMIILGKTSTPEFGAACYTEPELALPARTPWDLTRSAGGSSGGAGSAVAAGLVPVAHGSDSAGSIRIPASACGLVGLKPTRGRVSCGPVSGETTGLFANGVLARDVLDAAALLDVLAVPMPGDPFWRPRPETSYVEQARSPLQRLRVGRYHTPALRGVPVADVCIRAWEEASDALVELGHRVEDIACPFPPEMGPLFQTLFAVTAASFPLEPTQQASLRPQTTWLREQGERVSGPELMRTIAAVQQIGRGAAMSTAGFDLVLTPTLAQLPAEVGHFRSDTNPQEEFERQKRFSPFAAPYNVTGQPSINMPLYWSAEGLPVGVMLTAEPDADGLLLNVAYQLEQARPWAHRRPPMW
jgi:amidase